MTISQRSIIGAIVLIAVVAGASLFYELSPASAQSSSVVFEVKQGDGFRTVISHLYENGLIRSSIATELYALVGGAAFEIQPGLYRLDPSMSSVAVLQALTANKSEVTVTIPEGSTIYDIDRILSQNLVIQRGDLINSPSSTALEGELFPDTYDFFTDAAIKDVIQKFLNNFAIKTEPLLSGDQNAGRDLIIASIVQKEVSSSTDQEIVAGILEKRLAAGMPLDVDATICYIKQQQAPLADKGCYPLTSLDFETDSPYNTYLYKGLPPTPIGNPGVSAISATIHPQSSPYWFYLSDPKTGATIYAKTLAQQNANREKYLFQQ